MFHSRKSSGFTLIELLVVVVIIGILAAIALPNFIGAQKKAKVAQVKSNMHTAQLAAESYATDTAGVYSTTVAGLSPYYPGGGNTPTGASGNYPLNPFSGHVDAPTLGSVTNVTTSRAAHSGTTTGTAGNVQYSVVVVGVGNDSYAVIGFDDAGKSVPGFAGLQLVLSNQ